MISRVLAVAGAGVTLVGVVMLLILAAQAGWFGPELRVGVGAVFSIALVYIGSRVFGKPGGRVGGIAVAATGIAGLYLDVVAMTVIYEWLETSIGLVAAFGIAAAGVALAVSWRSQAMAVLILTGVALWRWSASSPRRSWQVLPPSWDETGPFWAPFARYRSWWSR